MSKIPWRGKNTNFLEVANIPGSKYKTVQSAIDAVSGATEENRFLVYVTGGEVYDERVTHDVSHCDLYIAPGAVIRQDSGVTSTGGTLRIGWVTLTEDVWVGGGGRVVRNAKGEAKPASGSPPEGAIYVGGAEDNPGTTRRFDQVIIEGIIAEGVHDGIQLFGVDSSQATTGFCMIKNCLIRCCHDALTYKGAMKLLTYHNQIEVDSAGISPYLDDIGSWKHTGFHMNLDRGHAGAWTASKKDRYWESHHDSFSVYARGNTGGTNQDKVAGILIYDQGVSSDSIHPVRVYSPTIKVWFDEDYSPSNFVGGVLVTFDGGSNIPDGDFIIRNADIDVHQWNTGVSAPADVWAVRLEGDGVATNVIEVTGDATIVNDKGAGNAHVCRANGATDTIHHRIRTRQTNDTGGAGTLTQMAVAT